MEEWFKRFQETLAQCERNLYRRMALRPEVQERMKKHPALMRELMQLDRDPVSPEEQSGRPQSRSYIQ